jgi:hypothetical protein
VNQQRSAYAFNYPQGYWEQSYHGTCFTRRRKLFIGSLHVNGVNVMEPPPLYQRIYIQTQSRSISKLYTSFINSVHSCWNVNTCRLQKEHSKSITLSKIPESRVDSLCPPRQHLLLSSSWRLVKIILDPWLGRTRILLSGTWFGKRHPDVDGFQTVATFWPATADTFKSTKKWNWRALKGCFNVRQELHLCNVTHYFSIISYCLSITDSQTI